MRHVLLIVIMAALLAGCSEVPAPPPPPGPSVARQAEAQKSVAIERFPTNFSITLNREYGMWKFTSCVLELRVSDVNGDASLACEGTNGARLMERQKLTHQQTVRLRQLVPPANLYGPGHVGEDHTPHDGIFETLRFRPLGGGRAAVLVTSDNKTFEEVDARRELLQLLRQIESGLSKDAR